MTLNEVKVSAVSSKKTLLMAGGAGLIGSVFVTALMVPSYQSRALVALGTIASSSSEKTRFLEDPKLTVVKWGLEAKRLLDPDAERDKRLHELVVLMHAHEGVLQVIARASEPEIARKYAQDLADRIVDDQGRDFTNYRNSIDQTRKNLNGIRTDLEGSLSSNRVGGGTGSVSDRLKLLSDRVNLENRTLELEMAASGINSRPTAHLQQAVAAKRPISPSWIVNLLLGALIGLLVGVYLNIRRTQVQ